MLHDARRSGAPVDENSLVRSAVATTKLPTLTAEDHALFSSLLRDTWPGMPASSGADEDADLRAAIERALEARGLVADAEQVLAVAMLHEAILPVGDSARHRLHEYAASDSPLHAFRFFTFPRTHTGAALLRTVYDERVCSSTDVVRPPAG